MTGRAPDGPFGPGGTYSMVSDDFHALMVNTPTVPALFRLLHLVLLRMNTIGHAEVGGRRAVADVLRVGRVETVSETVRQGIDLGLFTPDSSPRCVVVSHAYHTRRGDGRDSSCAVHKLGRYAPENRSRRVRNDRKAPRVSRPIVDKAAQRAAKAEELRADVWGAVSLGSAFADAAWQAPVLSPAQSRAFVAEYAEALADLLEARAEGAALLADAERRLAEMKAQRTPEPAAHYCDDFCELHAAGFEEAARIAAEQEDQHYEPATRWGRAPALSTRSTRSHH